MKNVYTVNSDALDGFNQGDELDTADKVVSYYVALYRLGTDPPADLRTQLSDEEILKIVEYIDGEGAEADGKRYEALVKAVKVKPTISATGSKARLLGIAIGQALTADFDAAMNEVSEADDIVDNSLVNLARLVETSLPKSGNGKLNVPFPGSVENTKYTIDGLEVERKLESYDRWSISQPGQGKQIGSVYADAFLQRPEGKAIQETLRQIDTPETAEKSVTHANGETTTIAQFKAMTDKSRASARVYWAKKLTKGTDRLRSAVKLLLHIESLPDRVQVYLASEPVKGAPEIKMAGKVVCPAGFQPIKSTKPIILVDAANPASATDPFALSTFMDMIVAGSINDPHRVNPKAVGETATLADLVATIARAPQQPGGDKGEANKVAPIPEGNVKAFWDYINAVHQFVDTPTSWVAIVNENKNNKLPVELLVSMQAVVQMLGAITSQPKNAVSIKAFERQVADEEARVASEKAAKLAKTG